MDTGATLALPTFLPPELIDEVASGLQGADFWTLSQAMQSFDQLHDSVLREARESKGASVQLAFLLALHGAGSGIGQLAKDISFERIVRLWEVLRMRRHTGILAERSHLIISPIEADTVRVKLQDGTLVICAEHQRSSDPSARAFYVFPQMFSGYVDLDLYNRMPNFVRPTAHLFAFSGSESMVAILESEQSSYAIQLVWYTALPRSRLPIPAAWRMGPEDVGGKTCLLRIMHCFLAMFLLNPARLVIYNWKTGEALLVAQGQDLAGAIGFAFLTSQTFVLLRSDAMMVYCIPTTPSLFSQLEHAWLGLPKLHPSAEFRSLTLHASDGDPGLRSEFTLRQRMCVLVATIANKDTHEIRSIVIFVKSASILDACQQMPQSRERQWEDWAPQCCRALHLDGRLRISDGGIRGLRVVLQQWQTPLPADEALVDTRMIVFDFGDVYSISGIEDVLPGTPGASRSAVRRASSLILPGFLESTITTHAAFAYVISHVRQYDGAHTCPNEVLLDDRCLLKVFSTYDEEMMGVELEVFDA